MRSIAGVLQHLGSVAGYQGDVEQAARLLHAALALFRKLGDRGSIAITLRYQGKVAHDQGEWSGATALYQESLALAQELDEQWEMAACLEGLAGIAAEQNWLWRAARLWGAAEAIREQIGAPQPPAEHVRYEAAVGRARAALGEHAFTAGWAEGRAMTLEQAIAYALHDET